MRVAALHLRSFMEIKKRYLILSPLLGVTASQILIGSNLLSLPLTVLALWSAYLLKQRKLERRRTQLAALWPELLDHMISGLRSGLSIAETLVGLADRGPELARPIFNECQLRLGKGADLSQIFNYIKEEFDDPVADQVCEVLDFARGTGSRDTAITLRTLGDFIRSDIAVRGEIGAKLGWIKNSAAVAALAPWILLLILSSQPSTIRAYSTASGTLIILVGIALSFIAYIWMMRVGRVKVLPRIFIGSH